KLFDPISNLSPKIFFNDVTGILQGFIDLIFLWNKKYYILDYKSNWLGKDNKCYSINNIKKEIIQHRYDLQYQIYTLAIHQYLKSKLKKYTYQENFGGIFYLFLRGMNKKNNNNSIFYTCPNYELVKKL
ncbi:MAG: exodeoxyribonuclease V subunit beta, partial [Buchnera aphidicola]|nr:exodeoxyribonuclease V subunit beta [Buchnera aphidicola]